MHFSKSHLAAFIFLIVFHISTYTSAQVSYSKSELQVVQLLEQQAKDWNEGNIEAFMEGYWRSPDLVFIGSKGPTYGWSQTLMNYKKGYPNKGAMGSLRFDLLQVTQQSRRVVSVVGKFILERKDETLDGHFLLIVKKIKGEWNIIADHTS